MRKKVLPTISLCALAVLTAAPDASAVPGLNSPSSVKEITRMLKQYTVSGGTNIYELEHRFAEHPTATAEALIDILDTSDEPLKINAVQLLQRIVARAECTITTDQVKTIVALLRASDNAKIQDGLIAVLGSIGPKNDLVKSTIVETIKTSKESSTRRAGVVALSHLAKEERPAMHAASTAVLLEVLKNDESPVVRGAAATALGGYKADSALAVPALAAAMDDNYLQCRVKVAQALANYSQAGIPALPKLIQALKSETDHSMRSACLNAIRSIDPQSPEVLKMYSDALDDPQMADMILQYIGDVGPRGAEMVPKLIVFLNGANKSRSCSAARCLGSMGGAAKEAIPALTAAAQGPDVQLKHYAERALRQITATTTDGAQAFN
jgi:HEAT repeat protein